MLVHADTEFSNVMNTTESSLVPRSDLDLGQRSHCLTPGSRPGLGQSPPQLHLQQSQQPTTPQHQWDINDSTLPVPDEEDSFDLWPSGHCRRVYRGDSDDARRHVSGWAMRNTNNHNALILKKSCLGVLVCSMDCLLESGRKVHLRPAICDKARRKQMGKPCPNPGCSGKLDLLSCRGHCGYPVTHFWRHLAGSVYFQAKGYHDHPRPEVKSLSEKGRNAYSKQLRRDNISPSYSLPLKRRLSMLTNPDSPDKKLFFPSKDDVLCSCSPFECVCPKKSWQKPLVPSNCPYPPHHLPSTYTPQGYYPPHSVASYGTTHDPLHPTHTPFTQISITNTCLPPPSLDLSIPTQDFNKACSKISLSYPSRHVSSLQDGSDEKMQRRSPNDPMSAVTNTNLSNTTSGITRQTQNLGTDQSCFQPGHLGAPPTYLSCVGSDISAGEINQCGSPTLVNSSTCRPIPGCDSESTCQSAPPQQYSLIKTECAENADLPSQTYPHNELATSGYMPSNPYSNITPIYESRSDISPRPASHHNPGQFQLDTNPTDSEGKPTYITLSPPKKSDGLTLHELQTCRLGELDKATSPTMTPYNCGTQGKTSMSAMTPFCDQSAISSSAMSESKRSLSQPRYSQCRASPPSHLRLHPGGGGGETAPHYSARGGTLGQFPFPHSVTPNAQTPQVNYDPCAPAYPGTIGFPNTSNPLGHYCNDVFPGSTQQQYRNPSINITLTYN